MMKKMMAILFMKVVKHLMSAEKSLKLTQEMGRLKIMPVTRFHYKLNNFIRKLKFCKRSKLHKTELLMQLHRPLKINRETQPSLSVHREGKFVWVGVEH